VAILKNEEETDGLMVRYEAFEKAIFEEQIQETAFLVDKTTKFMTEIDDKMDSMAVDLAKVKEEASKLSPQTNDQISQLNKI